MDGTEGVTTDLPTHALNEWILIDSTPVRIAFSFVASRCAELIVISRKATCANLGMHSLYPPHSFDLVIAGPNFGRNTGSAFALSS